LWSLVIFGARYRLGSNSNTDINRKEIFNVFRAILHYLSCFHFAAILRRDPDHEERSYPLSRSVATLLFALDVDYQIPIMEHFSEFCLFFVPGHVGSEWLRDFASTASWRRALLAGAVFAAVAAVARPLDPIQWPAAYFVMAMASSLMLVTFAAFVAGR